MRVLLLTILILVSFSQLMAQSPLSEKQWQEEKGQYDYTDEHLRPPPEPNKDEKKERNLPNISEPKTKFGGLRYIIMAVVGGGLLVLLFFMFSNTKFNRQVHASSAKLQFEEDIEERIHEVDLTDLLKQAIESEQYEQAVRFGFLILIKMLSERQLLKWAKEKTNWEYYDELNEYDVKQPFSQAILAFEYVRYGGQEVNANRYKEIDTLFNQVKTQIPVVEEV
ncbi:MAG: DUF4129 domain-containing protein [Bacteroidetes bacterium]|nr:DUF4129 domain-containing protein [Bacteroidota bacterium]